MSHITEIEPHDDVLLIAVLKASLDDASTHQMVDDVLTAAAQRPGVPIVLDLDRVKFAPSVALGALVQLSKSMRLDGRRIAMIRINHRIMGAIRVTHLHQVLEIHNSIEQVVAASPKKRG